MLEFESLIIFNSVSIVCFSHNLEKYIQSHMYFYADFETKKRSDGLMNTLSVLYFIPYLP